MQVYPHLLAVLLAPHDEGVVGQAPVQVGRPGRHAWQPPDTVGNAIYTNFTLLNACRSRHGASASPPAFAPTARLA